MKIVSITKLKEPFETYNLHIEDNHNYFAEGICVSNCHLYKAKSLKGIMEKLVDCPYRIGTTGTLDDMKTHRLIIEGLFGSVLKVITTKQLIEKDQLSDLKIECLVLKYPKEEAKKIKKATYYQEIDYIVSHKQRNIFLRNLILTRKGNTLLLFRLIEKHGRIIHQLVKKQLPPNNKRKIFFVYGGTDAESREKIRKITEQEHNAIIIASIGVFSVGINIKRLHNIIFASPSKSRIQIFQSIGRVLRKEKTKTHATLYDVADDLSYQHHKNYTLNHFLKRVEYYDSEYFQYKIHEVQLK